MNYPLRSISNSLLETSHGTLLVFSVPNPDDAALIAMGLAADNLPFQPIMGRYKWGQPEPGLVVPAFIRKDLSVFLKGQESVLRLNEPIPAVLDGSHLWVRRAELECLDSGTRVPLGLFRKVAQEVAEAAADYTFDPIWRQFYITVSEG